MKERFKKEHRYNPYYRHTKDSQGYYIIRPGDVLGDRYEIMRQLGEGTFGRVVKAYDWKRNIYVAVKIIRDEQKYHEAAHIELDLLYRLARRDPLDLKNCLTLRNHFLHCNHVCMVFDFLYEDLHSFIGRYRKMTRREIWLVLKDLLEAIKCKKIITV
jgi:dual-specificity kinase